VLGKLGADLDVEDGRRAARFAAISALATIRSTLGSLDAVSHVVSVRGVVNATPDFTMHTQVIDGASEISSQSSEKRAVMPDWRWGCPRCRRILRWKSS